MSARLARLRIGALYAGGFLGPFGGGVVSSMLPEMGTDLGVSTGSAASTLSAYLFPFALAMLVSGTLGARWGRVRTVRLAYLLYVVSSLLCAVAPTLDLLLGARALQGIGNSFTTPLLLASLAAVTPRERLGRVLGTFGALQAAGQTSAPLVGGLAAEFDWRYAFVVLAVVAAILGLVGLPAATPPSTPGCRPERLRDALTVPVLRVAVVALLGWGALGGLNFLVAFRAEDTFGLSSTQRGLLLTVFGVAGILVARRVGGLIDRIGSRRAIVGAAPVGAVLVALAGTMPSLVVVGLVWAAAGVASQFILVGVNAAVLGSSGANRGGAVSVVQSFRFSGAAFAPLALTPLYGVHPMSAFVIPAVLLAVVAPLVMTGRKT
ncbi:MFS transporter [Rhodococcus sp. BP-349]|uniref:MFS transporter n=1 Tax=unclassified Rhodococcus (in: high G+C Gram-positive bacteria) TaxID=192944 RepID=UPI001C9A7CD5|nr:MULTISPECIES: MFS transporter [unclassified Rhodococcus (in: high G+C Gram-positive bacteria)]MBY6541246.1 MFS transporter [Rhodococcus sp. BP-363]MBY6544728.1 MFS transporter [Rhodococcus sp. BP-369]MBY6563958.1 MFS transporter [Rhodococcus sp. BP-370]MBY6579105.1 MFS transporter [Rhodococcus sp. BP-364]MBY6588406.1 MFS transporter [Rhodococcus sp. BP-358]